MAGVVGVHDGVAPAAGEQPATSETSFDERHYTPLGYRSSRRPCSRDVGRSDRGSDSSPRLSFGDGMGPESEGVMRIEAVARLDLPGAMEPGSVARVGDVLVVLSGSQGGPLVAVGLRLAMRPMAVRLWELELLGPPALDACADLALPAVVSLAGSSHALLVGGDRRVVVDAEDGRVIAESAGRPGSGGVPAATAEGALVPEGERLSCYDWSSAALRWEQRAPAGMLFDACGPRLCALNADDRPSLP